MDINFFQELKKEGGQGFYVGGFVRDKLMGYESKDFDIEVFGIEENKLQTILEKYGSVKIVGNFEIYLLEKNVEVYLSKEKKLETSAKRRDLTINAMYYDPLDDKIYDFFNGQKDIEEKILRYCNKETFIIDPLRIMRVAYFGAKYNFKIDEELMALIKENKEKILLVDSDRVFQQFEKILFLEENQKALEILDEMGVLQLFIKNTVNVKKIAFTKKDRLLLWSVFLYGEKEFNFIKNKNFVKEIKDLHWAYEELKIIKENFSKFSLKKIVLKVPIRRVLRFYYIFTKDIIFLRKIYRSYYSFKNNLEPLIKGRDLVNLGFSKRKEYGEILSILYEKQLREEITTKEEALNYLRKIAK